MKRIESRRLRAWKSLDACTVLDARDAAMSSQECEEAIRAAPRAKAALVLTDPMTMALASDDELAALVAELEALRDMPMLRR